MPIFVFSYCLLINLLGFYLMGLDKRRAKNKQNRVKESTLFTVAVLGGSLGTAFGMAAFRHKTKKRVFFTLVPLLFFVHFMLFFFYLSRLLQP